MFGFCNANSGICSSIHNSTTADFTTKGFGEFVFIVGVEVFEFVDDFFVGIFS